MINQNLSITLKQYNVHTNNIIKGTKNPATFKVLGNFKVTQHSLTCDVQCVKATIHNPKLRYKIIHNFVLVYDNIKLFTKP